MGLGSLLTGIALPFYYNNHFHSFYRHKQLVGVQSCGMVCPAVQQKFIDVFQEHNCPSLQGQEMSPSKELAT
jgi:hypothetical protein